VSPDERQERKRAKQEAEAVVEKGTQMGSSHTLHGERAAPHDGDGEQRQICSNPRAAIARASSRRRALRDCRRTRLVLAM
jgi:hypothetical protein